MAVLRQALQEMFLDAQFLDVYFTHLDVTGTTTRTLSSIRVEDQLKHFSTEFFVGAEIYDSFLRNDQKAVDCFLSALSNGLTKAMQDLIAEAIYLRGCVSLVAKVETVILS